MPPDSSRAQATDEQHDGLLREIAGEGRLVASVGSETNPRSARSGDYSSELTPDGDGWRLTCHKFFASLAPAADYLLLWVAVPGDQPYPERTVTVLVPRDAPGVELIDQWDVMGMRPTVSWGVKIEDHRVEPQMVFGAPGAWVRDDPRTFTLGFASNHLGAAQAAFDFALEFVRERPYMAGATSPSTCWASWPATWPAPARPSTPPPRCGSGASSTAPSWSRSRRCTWPSASCSRPPAAPSTSAAPASPSACTRWR